MKQESLRFLLLEISSWKKKSFILEILSATVDESLWALGFADNLGSEMGK